MTEHASFDARLDLVPQSPGVYLMKDERGDVIYVGKAIDLRQRLSSHFSGDFQGDSKQRAMISHVRDFSYLLCENELEAFVLESNLIKRYQPFYNILLKDDHDYPYIRVTLQELYPRILKAYRIGPDREEGARYYGPYLNADLREALRTIHEIFPLKTCRRVFPRDIGKERPCLNYDMGRCIGPCTGLITAEDYRAVVMEVCDYLEGRYDKLLERFDREMGQAAERLDFEAAAKQRDRKLSLQRLQERQIAVLGRSWEGDVLGIAENKLEFCVQKLEVRGGKISGTSTHFIKQDGSTTEEVLSAYIAQYYLSAAVIPDEIILDHELPNKTSEELANYLSELRGSRRKVRILWPQRGEKRQVVAMATRNAKGALQRRALMVSGSQELLDRSLISLARYLELVDPPTRIEAYDVANLGSDAMTCGMVVFEHGKVRRNLGRLFNIKRVEGQDDYAAMAEALDRRLKRWNQEEFARQPDLILVDGGVGHVNAMQRVLDAHGLPNIPLAGIVKDQRHRTRGLVRSDGVIFELADELGLSGRKKSQASDDVPGQPESFADKQLVFDGGSQMLLFADEEGEDNFQSKRQERDDMMAVLRLLTAIQNEVHRQANSQHQRLRKKKTFRYRLEEIPGVGPARRKRLMEAFSTIKEISEASYEELLKRVPTLGENVARSVYEHFHPEETQREA